MTLPNLHAWWTADGQVAALNITSEMPGFFDIYPYGNCFGCFATRTLALDLSGVPDGVLSTPIAVDEPPYYWILSGRKVGDFAFNTVADTPFVSSTTSDSFCASEYPTTKIIRSLEWFTASRAVDFDYGWEVSADFTWTPGPISSPVTPMSRFAGVAGWNGVVVQSGAAVKYGVAARLLVETYQGSGSFGTGPKPFKVWLDITRPCGNELLLILDTTISEVPPWIDDCFMGWFTMSLSYRNRTIICDVSGPFGVSYHYQRKVCWPFYCRCDAIRQISPPLNTASGIAGSNLCSSTTHWSRIEVSP